VALFQPNSRSIKRHASRKRPRAHWTTAPGHRQGCPMCHVQLSQSCSLIQRGQLLRTWLSSPKKAVIFGRSLGSQQNSDSHLSELAIAIA
jgi:hypothetical protein